MITAIIKQLTAEYLDRCRLRSAYDINSGQCEEFAEDVCSRVLGAIALWDDELVETDEPAPLGGHKIIEYDGRYYDAECPDGVDDWQDIPFFKRVAV